MSSIASAESKSVLDILYDKFYEKEYSDVKSELRKLNKLEITPETGIPTPDGGEFNLHKYMWNSKDGVECILLLYVNPESNMVNDLGLSSGNYKTVKDSDGTLQKRRRKEHEKVCIAGFN